MVVGGLGQAGQANYKIMYKTVHMNSIFFTNKLSYFIVPHVYVKMIIQRKSLNGMGGFHFPSIHCTAM